MKNYFKQILSYSMLLLTLIMFQSCNKDNDNKRYCQEKHTCNINITNLTGYDILVDVNYTNEHWLLNGQSIIYKDIPSGYVKIWGSFDGTDWVYWDRNISDCYTLNFDIVNNKKSPPQFKKSVKYQNTDIINEYVDISSGCIDIRK